MHISSVWLMFQKLLGVSNRDFVLLDVLLSVSNRDFCVVFVCRIMADSLLAQFIFSGQGFYTPLDDYTTYSDLCGVIRRRFKMSSHDVFKLQYSSPSCAMVYLDSEADLKMLLYCAKVYKMDHVDIAVVSDVGCVSDCCSGISDAFDENDYLGDAFRDRPHKSYLSDEWSSFIKGVGQKFPSISDFRDKLRKYTVQTGFCYVLARNDSLYVHAVCENYGIEGCEWFVKGSVASLNQCFYVTEFLDVQDRKSVV